MADRPGEEFLADLLVWREKHAEQHLATLEEVVNDVPPSLEEVVRFARVRDEFSERVRGILLYYDKNREEAPDGEEWFEQAASAFDMIEEKELLIESYIQKGIDSHTALGLKPDITPDEFRGGRHSFDHLRAVVEAYEPIRVKELEGLAERVARQVDQHLLRQQRQSKLVVPPDRKAEEPDYQRLRTQLEGIKKELETPAYQPETKGSRKRLKEKIDALDNIITDSAMKGYDLANGAKDVLADAVSSLRKSAITEQKRFWRRATIVATAVGVSITASLAIYRLKTEHELVRAPQPRAASVQTSLYVTDPALPDIRNDVAIVKKKLGIVAEELTAEKARNTRLEEMLTKLQAEQPQLATPETRHMSASVSPSIPFPPQQETPSSPSYFIYVVPRGATLSGVHQRYIGQGTWQELKRLNERLVTHPLSWLFPGMPLVIPAEGLRTTEGLRPATAQEEKLYQRAGVTAPLYQAPCDMSFLEVSQEVTGSSAYAEEIRKAYSGVNQSLGPRIRRNDFVQLPTGIPLRRERLYGGG